LLTAYSNNLFYDDGLGLIFNLDVITEIGESLLVNIGLAIDFLLIPAFYAFISSMFLGDPSELLGP